MTADAGGKRDHTRFGGYAGKGWEVMTTEEFQAHQDSNDGYCTACEEWTTGGVEPDAENYDCEMCGEEGTVQGALNVLLEELVDIGEDDELGGE